MEERQLDRVGDLLDLVVEAADVGVGDVGHLLEHELLDLGSGQLLEQQARARVHQDVVAGPQRRAGELFGQLGHALLVGPSDDSARWPSASSLLEGDDLAGRFALRGPCTTLYASLSTTSAPAATRRSSMAGESSTRILRPAAWTSTVPSSFRPSSVAYAAGGWLSLSTSSRRAEMWSRASRRVKVSFSFWLTAWASCPLVSSSRSSSVLHPLRRVLQPTDATGRPRPRARRPGVPGPHARPRGCRTVRPRPRHLPMSMARRVNAAGPCSTPTPVRCGDSSVSPALPSRGTSASSRDRRPLGVSNKIAVQIPRCG